MDKTWIKLAILAVVVMAVVIGWDIFLTVSGAKNQVIYTLVDISPNLYGNVEQRMRAAENFGEFERQAAAELGTTSSSSGSSTSSSSTTTSGGLLEEPSDIPPAFDE